MKEEINVLSITSRHYNVYILTVVTFAIVSHLVVSLMLLRNVMNSDMCRTIRNMNN